MHSWACIPRLALDTCVKVPKPTLWELPMTSAR